MPTNDIESVLTQSYAFEEAPKEIVRNPLSIPDPKRISNPDPAGKPEKVVYTPSICALARRILWNQDGTMRTLARLLGVSVSTLNEWKKKHPAFKAACDEGTRLCTDTVECALRSVAVVHDEIIEENGPDGKIVTTRKNAVDVKAAIAILKANRPEYREKPNLAGTITGERVNINFNTFGCSLPQGSPFLRRQVESRQAEPAQEEHGSQDRE